MYRFLREPRWIALLVLVPIVMVAFYFLSQWQWGRYEGRKQMNSIVANHTSLPAAPVADLIPVGSIVGIDQEFRIVTASGTYDAAAQVLIRQRPLNGANGYWIATPLVTTDGATLIVNRGWMRADKIATAVADAPAPPAGQVTVTGTVQFSETGPAVEASDIPAGQVSNLDVSKIGAAVGKPVYPAYINLSESQPGQAAGLTPMPLPPQDEGPHLSYAMQWIAFAILSAVGVILLIRREAASRREAIEDIPGGARKSPRKSPRSSGRKSGRKPKYDEAEYWDDPVDQPEVVRPEVVRPKSRQPGDGADGAQDSEPSRTAP